MPGASQVTPRKIQKFFEKKFFKNQVQLFENSRKSEASYEKQRIQKAIFYFFENLRIYF